MSLEHAMTAPVSNFDDVISHDGPTARVLQPLPALTDEVKSALYRDYEHLPFSWDENGFPYLSVLAESYTFGCRPAML
jgi:hypothetical protein